MGSTPGCFFSLYAEKTVEEGFDLDQFLKPTIGPVEPLKQENSRIDKIENIPVSPYVSGVREKAKQGEANVGSDNLHNTHRGRKRS